MFLLSFFIHQSFFLTRYFPLSLTVQTNMIQIIFHFIGGIFLSFIITQYWGYYALWPVVITCNFPPLLSEIYMLVKLYVIRTAPFNSSLQ